MDFELQKRITVPSLITLVKAILSGFLIGEVWYFSQVIASIFNNRIENNSNHDISFFLCAIVSTLIICYLYSRGFHLDAIRIIKSCRVDILITIFLGFSIASSFGGLGSSKFKELLTYLSFEQLTLLLLAPIAIGFLLTLRAHFRRFRNGAPPFFISDVEKSKKEDDLLNFSEEADRFAERVYNGGSSDSLVFGIDAPWGIGKSTFVNFCTEYWQKKHRNNVIVFRFNPLRYEDRSNLLEKFVDGLVRSIQKSSFVPEIRPLISRYSRFIKGKSTFSLFGMNIELSPGDYTVDDAFEDLELALARLDKKIIIVVDDLDRLNFSAVKDVLFAIKKSFTLPNISYVLCYDTENIVALGKDSEDVEKVREFLEKFINVKLTLFLEAGVLSKYISDNFDRALKNNLQIDPLTLEKIKEAVEAIREIYASQEFVHYQSFLGDIRKLKRLINTLVQFEIEKTDFENSDFNKHDLIHLLLIYINYPSIFRKIYSTETDGKRGFFSLLTPHEDGYPKTASTPGARAREDEYKNSESYESYTKDLEANQKFLLDKIFSAERLENAKIDSVSEKEKKTLACFNGGIWGAGANLEEYLKLIVRLSKPQKRGQYRFYLNLKDKFVGGTSIEDILSAEEFTFSQSESTHEQFWRIVINSMREFSSENGSKLITYLLDHIKDYSLYTNKEIGVGLRDDVDYFLVKLLDGTGWSDEKGGHINNNEENVREIAEWVFGENRHADKGVLTTLADTTRGPLGFYDLLAFRLFCSADRGGDIFNLQRALSKHGDPAAPTEGNTQIIAIEEMREISQKVFKIFEEQYITPNKNFFDLVDDLSLSDFAGKYLEFIEGKTASGEISLSERDKALAALKSRVKSFTVYQLGNAMVSHGVGCGYYDETGRADEKGILKRINDYLFGQCFNPDGGQKNYEHFLDYLLLNFTDVFPSIEGDNRKPHVSEFTKVLDKRRLAEYWKANASSIKALNLTEKEKTVEAGNYTTSYKKNLEEVYKVLDALVEEMESQNIIAVMPEEVFESRVIE